MKTISFEVEDEDEAAITAALAFVQERNELLAGAELSVDLGAMLAEICRGWMDMLGVSPAVTCIGCGCDDNHACVTDGVGCSWLAVDRDTGRGVCSSCPESLAEFEGEQRVRALHETIAEFVS